MQTDPRTKPRPEFRNIHITDLMSYRLPLAGMVSILHRASGALMFLLLPLVLWVFDTSVGSEQGYASIAGVFASFPAKVLALALFWALAHHLCAGVRHLLADVFQTVSKEQGRRSAIVSLVVSLAATAAFAAHLFLGV